MADLIDQLDYSADVAYESLKIVASFGHLKNLVEVCWRD